MSGKASAEARSERFQAYNDSDDENKKERQARIPSVGDVSAHLGRMRQHTEFAAGKHPVGDLAPPDSSPVTGIAAETVITVHGKIIAIDSASNQVTLQGPSGKTVTLTVNNPYNLQSLKAGDRYLAQFTESLSVVGKGSSDKPPVATLAAGLWSAKPGEIPGAAAAQAVQLVVVVSAIDQADQRVTLQAPDGSTENIHVTNPAALQGVQVGDRIAITLAQSIVIALAPEAASDQ